MVGVDSDITENRRNVFYEVDDLLLILDVLLEFRPYELQRESDSSKCIFGACTYLEQT